MFNNFLVAVDDSTHTKAAAEYGGRSAAKLGAMVSNIIHQLSCGGSPCGWRIFSTPMRAQSLRLTCSS
jgi:hypothetical protein